MDMSKLKMYIERILNLQKKYGWMMDSYVLDFFTADLWGKLPEKWTNVLAGLQPQEIAHFLLEIYSPVKLKQTSPQPKFRTVWPLELLAFIASCHALKLNNQTWIDKFKQTQNATLKNINRSNMKSRNTETIECKTNITSNAENIQVLEQPDVQALNIVQTYKTAHIDESLTLSHLFQRNIKPKKQYEMNVLSKVICEQAENLKCWNIVDVGAGLGHLSRLLSYGYKLRVVTIEGNGCHQSGAEKIDQKLLTRLEKKAGAVNRSLVHVIHHINSDISVTEFTNVVLQAFTNVENNIPCQNTANPPKRPESPDNFLIVGLHTCGDLATTLLRVFSQCENAVGMILLGCCYMKLTYEIPQTDQGTVAQKMTKLTTALTGSSPSNNSRQYSVEICNNPSHNRVGSGNFDRKNDFEFADQSNRSTCTEVFTDYKKTMLKNEDLNGERTLPAEHDELKIAGNFTPTAGNERILGYPMSDYVKSLSHHQQTYNALESACHAIERYHKKLLELSPTLKLHYYRAMLELLLKQQDPDCPRRQIRTLRTKKATNMTLTEYVNSACDILRIKDGRPTSQDIKIAEEIHAGMQFNVVVFYVLRLLMAPVIEGLLLVDRLIYIKEKHPDINARIAMLFDPDLSPRNFAIILDKNTLKIET